MLKLLKQQVQKDKKSFIIGHIFAFLAVLVSIPIPLFFPVLIDELLLNKPGAVLPILKDLGISSAIGFTLTIFFCIFSLRTLYWLCDMVSTYQFVSITQNITQNLRQKLLQHLSITQTAAFESMGVGALSSKMITDIKTIEAFNELAVSKFFVAIVSLMFIAIILVQIHTTLGLLMICFNPLIVCFEGKND